MNHRAHRGHRDKAGGERGELGIRNLVAGTAVIIPLPLRALLGVLGVAGSFLIFSFKPLTLSHLNLGKITTSWPHKGNRSTLLIMKSQPNYAVLSIGQCSADEPRIRTVLQKVGASQVLQAHSSKEALSMILSQEFHLVLVNRILDATGESGHTLISQVRAQRPSQRIMMVSNYSEAQKEAVALGALFGFGKDSLSSAETAAKLREIFSESGNGE